MKSRKLLVLMALVAAVALVTPSAFAGCIPPKSFSSWNAVEGVYKYVYFGDTSGNPANLVGSFWQSDNPTANSQDYPAQEWLLDNYYYPGTDSWYMNGNLGDARPDCIFGSLTVEASNIATGGWFTAQVGETPGSLVDFDFSIYPSIDTRGTNVQPRVNSSGRTGDIVNLNVTVQPGVVAGTAVVDETRVYQRIGPDGTPPADRNTDPGWSLIGTIPGNGGTTDVAVDCAGVAVTDNAFIGTSYVVNGTAGQIAASVTEVECDPTLADPGDRFKLVDPDNLNMGKGRKGRR